MTTREPWEHAKNVSMAAYLKIRQNLPVCRPFEPNAARRRLAAAFISESCTLQNGLEAKLLSVKIDSTLSPPVVSPDYV